MPKIEKGQKGLRENELDWFVVVKLDSPVPRAEIRADDPSQDADKPARNANIVYRRGEDREHPDLYQTRSVTFTTIRRLGELLVD